MSTKNSRSGGKYSGNHTALVSAAITVCDIAHTCPSVVRISPGFIKGGLRPAGGKRRVKISQAAGALRLSVRDNTSNQEVYVYTNNTEEVKRAIIKGARGANIIVSFSKADN